MHGIYSVFFFYRGIELVLSTEIFFLVPVQSSKLWYRDNTSSITLYLPMSIRKHTLYAYRSTIGPLTQIWQPCCMKISCQPETQSWQPY